MSTKLETVQTESETLEVATGTDAPTDDDNAGESTTEVGNNEPESFPRSYVEKLRQESAEHRNKAKKVDQLSQRLVTAIVAKIGTLHDATDLPFSDDLLDDDGMPDEQKINEAVKQLASTKPHLVRIRPSGDVGQGSSSTQPSTSLLDVIQGR
jgi:hypothetical protein